MWTQMWNNCIFLFNRLTSNFSLYSSWWQKSCSYFRIIFGPFRISQINLSFFLSRLASNFPWPSKLSSHWWEWVNVSMISLENREDKTRLISSLVSPTRGERLFYVSNISELYLFHLKPNGKKQFMASQSQLKTFSIRWLQIHTKWHYSSKFCLLNSVI